jgi:hypothetical protein
MGMEETGSALTFKSDTDGLTAEEFSTVGSPHEESAAAIIIEAANIDRIRPFFLIFSSFPLPETGRFLLHLPVTIRIVQFPSYD